MPIKRFEESVRPQFPRLGKLRKGAPKGEDGSIGPDLEWFRFTSDHPEVEATFYAALGPEPAAINVFLPYAEVDRCFSYWQEVWSEGGLIHRCDGETCILWRKKDGTYSTELKPCPGGCKEVGRLEVIIPELVMAGFVGYVTAETHSKNDIPSILGSLMETARQREGHPDGLKGIQFVLRRVPQKISTPPWDNDDSGKRKRVVKWLVKLAPAADWMRLQLEMAHAQAMGLEGGEILGLPKLVGDNSDEVIEAEIVKEGATDDDSFTCKDCGYKIAPYATKDGVFSVSRLVEMSAALSTGPGPFCGTCLKKRKENAVNGSKAKQEKLPV
jgi:hypothetical protein